MIVSYDKKFIFVGIPFSACSAISKELLERYGCETLLHKHASMPALLKVRPDIEVKNYEIIAVARDPIEMSLTLYHWLKDNRNEHFTKSENFVENGGTVTRRYRNLYSAIQEKSMTFEEYLDYCFRFVPFDGLLSENSKFITKIIRYEKLQDDFKSCFGALGLNIDRDLPGYNLTENKGSEYHIDQKILIKYFGPYLLYNAQSCQHVESYRMLDENAVSSFDLVKFNFFRRLKSYYRLKLDQKFMSRDVSHID